MKSMYVYMLKCADGKYYTGVTNNVERRLNEHNNGNNPSSFTFSRRPVALVYQQLFYDPQQAIDFEKRLKKWSVAKKDALANAEYDSLPLLSKKRFD
ncbi:GIY-YIG nuclease family protein [Bacteroidota bacterium]